MKESFYFEVDQTRPSRYDRKHNPDHQTNNLGNDTSAVRIARYTYGDGDKNLNQDNGCAAKIKIKLTEVQSRKLVTDLHSKIRKDMERNGWKESQKNDQDNGTTSTTLILTDEGAFVGSAGDSPGLVISPKGEVILLNKMHEGPDQSINNYLCPAVGDKKKVGGYGDDNLAFLTADEIAKKFNDAYETNYEASDLEKFAFVTASDGILGETRESEVQKILTRELGGKDITTGNTAKNLLSVIMKDGGLFENKGDDIIIVATIGLPKKGTKIINASDGLGAGHESDLISKFTASTLISLVQSLVQRLAKKLENKRDEQSKITTGEDPKTQLLHLAENGPHFNLSILLSKYEFEEDSLVEALKKANKNVAATALLEAAILKKSKQVEEFKVKTPLTPEDSESKNGAEGKGNLTTSSAVKLVQNSSKNNTILPKEPSKIDVIQGDINKPQAVLSKPHAKKSHAAKQPGTTTSTTNGRLNTSTAEDMNKKTTKFTDRKPEGQSWGDYYKERDGNTKPFRS